MSRALKVISHVQQMYDIKSCLPCEAGTKCKLYPWKVKLFPSSPGVEVLIINEQLPATLQFAFLVQHVQHIKVHDAVTRWFLQPMKPIVIVFRLVNQTRQNQPTNQPTNKQNK